MRQTLFFIPHEIGGLPIFGFGWLLAIVVIGGIIGIAYQSKKHGWTPDVKGLPPFFLVIAAIVAFVLPAVEVQISGHEQAFMLWQYDPGEAPLQGLPLRGYGIFLLIATISGLALARYRALQVGLSPDAIYNLAFYMFVGGILGARLFYIIQYWDEIHDPNSLRATLGNMVNFVEGGLVVYGSLIGALVAGTFFLARNKLPMLPIADLIAPSLALGLAIGRLGCLMNGCCFGGVCAHGWAIEFPQHSPAYYDQQTNGQFYGFRLAEDAEGKPVVADVTADQAAAAVGLSVGEVVQQISGVPTANLEAAQVALGRTNGVVKMQTTKQSYDFSIGALPEKSLPVHPTQLYSSLNALIMAVLVYGIFPHRRRDGEVFCLLIFAYAITRFMLEIIRTDEGSFGVTGMTISQNVSMVMLIGVAALAVYVWRQPRGTFWPTPQ